MYCSVNDIKNIVPEPILGQLANNDLQIELAINSATTTIDAYLSGSYPTSSTLGGDGASCAFLADICAKLAIYRLYMLNASDETPEIIQKSYSEAVSELEKLQKGVISLPEVDGAVPVRQAEIFCNKEREDRVF